MATSEPNYFADTYRVTTKGKEYVYAWRNGPRLPGVYGSPESIAAWLEATSVRKLGDKATIKGLITDFKASERWQGTAGRKSYSAATKNSYGFYLDKIEDEFGDIGLVAFERREIREHIARWRSKAFAASPRNGDYAIAVLRLLLTFAIRLGRLGANHAKAMESLYESDRSDMIWEDAELAAFEADAPVVIWRAVKLAELTGMRQSDLLKLEWVAVAADRIEIRTTKSRKRSRAAVPMYDELRAFLDTIPKEGPTVLVTERGKRAWGSGFGASFAGAAEKVTKAHPRLKARIEALHFHDLKGNAVTRFFIAGFRPHEIARIVGWKEAAVLDICDRYVSGEAVMKAQAKRLSSTPLLTAANDAEGGSAKLSAKLSSEQ